MHKDNGQYLNNCYAMDWRNGGNSPPLGLDGDN